MAERSVIQTLHGQGILLVAASGNDGVDGNLVSYPAGYDHVISVGAVDEYSRVAEFSTYNTAVDIAAPGVGVLSLGGFDDQEYIVFDGTSMATPHVAGVAALVWSQFPEKNVTEIEQALTSSAQDLGSCGKDPLSGHGLVDAVAAAMYLEGDSAASQNGNCIAIDLSLKTDDYGSETLYLVTSENDSSDIVFRGGPYPDDQRTTYEDTFTLPDGCYNLMWVDTLGDGSNDPNYGIGEITLDYGGTRQVASDGLSGRLETFRFGSCGTDVTSPPPVASPAPVSAPIASPVASPPAVACSAGESLLQVSLTTDQWAQVENHLYLYDVSAPADEFIWNMPLFQIEGNSQYEGEACLQLALKCFKFYFLDEDGDGFLSGGLTLILDGVVVLQISPGDQGDVYEAWSSATFWYQEFGTCPNTSYFNRVF